MTTVGELLRVKGSVVHTVGKETSVFGALLLMSEKNIGAVLVVEDEGIVGIFSERDYARQVVLKGRASKDTPVREVMTAEVVSVDPHQTIDDCMSLMTARHIRHLPVIDAGRLVGLLSIGDVVKAVIADKQGMIEHLENYITRG